MVAITQHDIRCSMVNLDPNRRPRRRCRKPSSGQSEPCRRTLAKKVAAVVGNSAFASQGIFNLANLVLSHKRPIKKDGPHSGPEISRVSFLLRTCSLWLPLPDWGEGEHVRC